MGDVDNIDRMIRLYDTQIAVIKSQLEHMEQIEALLDRVRMLEHQLEELADTQPIEEEDNG